MTDYLQETGLIEPLEWLGFHVAGYGCTTCIGNSGPLPEPVAQAIQSGELVVAAVLSGNRNFKGRIHSLVRANYMTSPPLVVAYALAGHVDTELKYQAEGEPLVVMAGKDYGSGSSRHWAAKGTLLLGIRAVIAQSYERIHRSNLIGMGVLPLQFKPGKRCIPWD